ncbi:MAG: adenine phosphoribosyltransferase [bacterium]|nr:adenine phosphoribosyltransferase [bacterium]MBU1916991.1 adenine phosphoribosyltransferase [bacterium]
MNLADYIRDVPDFPKQGILFKDITTLLKDPDALKESIQQMKLLCENQGITKVCGAESRGFIFGVPLAIEIGAGFVPIRKPGKLPAETLSEEYVLEYGTDKIEIHKDAIEKGEKVIFVDDLLATGGTAEASLKLLEKMEADVVGCLFLIELGFLNGREKLQNYPVNSLLVY